MNELLISSHYSCKNRKKPPLLQTALLFYCADSMCYRKVLQNRYFIVQTINNNLTSQKDRM